VLGLAHKATGVMKQNLVIALGVSGMLIIAAVFGLTHISQAVVLHEGSTLLVVANGLRLLGYRPQAPAVATVSVAAAQPAAS
jgi:Cd2+/Zn2+-exporting ATPase